MKKGFSSINFHTMTVQRFKGFCQKHGAPYSDTLDQMMDFFDKYQLAPSFNFGPTILDLRNDITKRVNAGIAILRDVEKHGVLPTKAMMEMLFEGGPIQNRIEEKGKLTMAESEQAHLDRTLELLKERELRIDLEEELASTKNQINSLLLERVKFVRNPLGPSRMQLEITPSEFEKLKQQFKSQEPCISP